MARSLFELSACDLIQALAAGACANERTGTGLTPLHAFADHPHAVAALLAHGADPNATNYMMLQAPLHMSTDAEAVSLLLAAGAQVDAHDGFGQTALHLACGSRANLPIARLLLDQGANPNVADYSEQRPLHLATTIALADLLLDAGADPRAQDRYGFPTFNTYRRPAQVSNHIAWRMRKEEADEEQLLLEAATAAASRSIRPAVRL